MKCIVLVLAFVALCSSYPYGYGSRNININEDGTIVITSAGGKKITITKGIGTSGQKSVDISVSGPNIPTKRIKINEQNDLRIDGQGEYNDVSEEYLRDKRSSKDSKKQGSQGETLTKIFSGYQGDVDQISYQQLLRDIKAAVQEGQLNSSIYDVLQSLNQVQGSLGLWGRQQNSFGGQKNILDLLREQAIENELRQLQKEQLRQQYQQGVRVPVTQFVQIPTNGNIQRLLGIPSGVNQGVSYTRDIGNGEWGVSGQDVSGINYDTPRVGRTLWGTSSVSDLWRGTYGQQVDPIGQSLSAQLSEVVDEERQILDEQRQIQLQQWYQQQQLQQLLEQQVLQQQQQQEQQRLQQWLQQVQQQQLQQQDQLLEQEIQQQPRTWRDYLLNGGRSYIQTRGQQGLWQQQPSVYSQRGLLGGDVQNVPVIQRYNVPLVL